MAEFARLVSDNTGGPEALQLLADTLVDVARCSAAAVFCVTGAQLELRAARNIPERACAQVYPVADFDGEFGRSFMGECGAAFVRSRTLPLVSSGGLFGAVVLLWNDPQDDAPWHDELANALVDLAATMLAMSSHVQRLTEANQELRKSRDVMARTEKLRAIGQMAAGIAHDLKNILNPLSLHLQLAQRANARGNAPAVEDGLLGMKQAVAHGTETLERLRKFSRQETLHGGQLLDVNTLAHEATLLAKPRMASSSGRLLKVLEEYGTPPPIRGDASEIVSAVLNLLVNAADAAKQDGHVTVSTGGSNGGGWIRVQDDGPGIPAEIQAHVFEPFFTTKGEEGTGLGLAMAHASLHRQGGTITLESEPGSGATFTLWLPAA